jgi:hypothetical protein
VLQQKPLEMPKSNSKRELLYLLNCAGGRPAHPTLLLTRLDPSRARNCHFRADASGSAPKNKAKHRKAHTISASEWNHIMKQVKEDGVSLNAVATLHNIGKQAVWRFMQNPTKLPAPVGRAPSLEAPIEAELCRLCKEARALGWGYTQTELRAAARQIGINLGVENFEAGSHWLKAFYKRNDMKGLKPKRTTTSRLTGASRPAVDHFFELLNKAHSIFTKLTGRAATAEDIANMDETGFKPDTAQGRKVVCGKEDKACFLPTSSSAGHVTAMYCGTADGAMMPPTLIMEGVKAQASYIAGAGDFKLTMSPQGFVDTGIFLSWLEDFSKWRGGKESILILDWHSSRSPLHVGLAALRLGIVVVMLPPNCTHILQPADRAVFRPLKLHFATLLQTAWAGKSVTKNNIASLIYAAHLRLETAEVSGKTKFMAWKAGFKKCGIFPFNPAAITDEDYAPADAISAHRGVELPVTPGDFAVIA